jgi:hypothetical protein
LRNNPYYAPEEMMKQSLWSARWNLALLRNNPYCAPEEIMSLECKMEFCTTPAGIVKFLFSRVP